MAEVVIVSRDELQELIVDSLSTVLRIHLNKEDELPPLLTRKEVADYFSVTVATVDNLTRAGVLKKHYVNSRPRFKREEVQEAFSAWKKWQR